MLARRLAGLMITDVMQAVSYLASRPEVDGQRIGAAGYSMGSFVLALTGAVEPRLRACVLVGGGNLDGVDGYWDNSKPMCQGLPYRSLGFLGDRGAVIYALHASRGPTLVYNGLADSVVAVDRHGEAFFADLRQRTVQVRGRDDGVFDTGFVAGASHRPYFVTRPVALWLEKHLDLPNWTAESLAAMPTTHIAEWSQKHNVHMDKLDRAARRWNRRPWQRHPRLSARRSERVHARAMALPQGEVDLRNLGRHGSINRPTTATHRPEDHVAVEPRIITFILYVLDVSVDQISLDIF